jgi:membrane fusion protein (multidrug efflux system)
VPEKTKVETVEKLPPLPPEPAPEPQRAPRRHRALWIVLIFGAIILVAGYFYWRYTETYEDTDDAEVEAHLVGVTSRIQGTIVSVHGVEDQAVNAGDFLVEVDPSDYQVAVEQAKANLAEANAAIQAENPNVPITQTTSETAVATNEADVINGKAAVAAAEGDLAAAQARLREAQANNTKAQTDVTRYKSLVEKDEVSREQYDTVVATAEAEAAAVDSARASADAAQKVVDQRKAQLAQAESRLTQASRNAPRQIASSRANLLTREASAGAAKARLDQALLNLSYTKITAPVAGVIATRSAEIGSTVQPGQQLFAISQISDLWVIANFKETQLKGMHPGQHVTIHVDALDRDFSGYVEYMPAATGAVTSLLPPENATGNYVKVVQRLPVRIRFNNNQQELNRLRPGMSVEPKVWLNS